MPKDNIEQVIEELDARVLENENSLRSGAAGTLDYVKEQLQDIAQTPDPQEAAQKAFNLMQDVDHAIVGEAAAKALLLREDGMELCVEVGKQKLLTELQDPSMRPDSFVRGPDAINGFSQEVILEGSPGMQANIRAQATDLRAEAALTDGNEMSAEERLEFEANLTSQMLDLSVDQHLGPQAESYLKAMTDVIEGDDPIYNQRMNQLAGEGASAEQVQQSKAKLAEGYKNNNSALRLISPVMNDLRGSSQSWGNASQMAQKIVSGYRNESLNNLSERFRPLGEKAFTPENKQKVAAMHQRFDAVQAPPSRGMQLIQGAADNAAQRSQNLAQAREANPQAVYTPPARGNRQDAPAPEVEAEGVESPKKSRLGSVRDALSNGASRLKNAVGGALERKGSEQKLSEVAPDKVEIYKSLQESVKQLQRMDGENAIGAALGDAEAGQEFKEGATAQTIERMKEEMAQMREQDPGLAQLDRSKVGQAVHSGVRDAAKSAGSRLKA